MIVDKNEGKRYVNVTLASYEGQLTQVKVYTEECSWVPILQDFLSVLSAEYGYKIQDSVRIKHTPWGRDEWYGSFYDDDEDDNN
jgi:cupin superfamily acireductone dioxygenase involved in methionine salvage